MQLLSPFCVCSSMKRILLCLFVSIGLALAATAADISGKWTGAFTSDSGEGGSAYLILTQSGTKITGSGGPSADEQWPGLQGSVNGNKVSFQVKSPDDGTIYKCDLVLDGDHLSGDVTFSQPDGQPMKGKLTLARVTTQ
jgi:hypothetical protein